MPASGKFFASKLHTRRGKGRDSQVFTTHRNAGLAHACYNDVVDEAREWGHAADEESGNGAPIGGVLGRVTIDTVEVVHVGYGYVTTSDDIVAAD